MKELRRRKRRGGGVVTMCCIVHLYLEQVFSAPLACTVIRNGHACLALSKTNLSTISAGQAVGKMIVN